MATEVLLIGEARITTVQLLDQVLGYLRQTSPLHTRSRLLDELRPGDFTSGTYPLIIRAFSPEAFALTKVLRRHGVPYGFYIDDNFWLLDPSTDIGRYYAERSQRHRLEQVVRHAATVIASTPLLRDFLGSRNDHVIQLDSFFDFSLIPELPPAPSGRRTVRGGFAASADRIQDLRPLINEVVEVLDENEHVEFEIIGVDDGELSQHPRIRSFPYQSSYGEYIEFQRSRQWDFGLAPLGAAASNLYKTDNKFREYAAQGIPGIYQDAAPYHSVRDGETGLLAGGSRSWGDAMRQYVLDPELRRRVRRDARLDAERRCALENVAPQWQAFFESAPGAVESPRALRRLRRALDFDRSPAARALRRGKHLLTNSWISITDDGFAATTRRTARFVRKRIGRR